MAVDTDDLKQIWVFNGARNRFPSAVFTERSLAEAWIQKNQLEGTLTAYPLNISIYEWAIEKEYFTPIVAQYAGRAGRRRTQSTQSICLAHQELDEAVRYRER